MNDSYEGNISFPNLKFLTVMGPRAKLVEKQPRFKPLGWKVRIVAPCKLRGDFRDFRRHYIFNVSSKPHSCEFFKKTIFRYYKKKRVCITLEIIWTILEYTKMYPLTFFGIFWWIYVKIIIPATCSDLVKRSP